VAFDESAEASNGHNVESAAGFEVALGVLHDYLQELLADFCWDVGNDDVEACVFWHLRESV